jgi:hypothetical protein
MTGETEKRIGYSGPKSSGNSYVVPVLKARLKGSLADDFRRVNILASDQHTASNPCGSVRLVAICRLAADSHFIFYYDEHVR